MELDVEIRHLRLFLAVAEEQHFGRAAARLHIAQPRLSQLIRRLEATVGAQLFERTTRRVELSPAGIVLRDRAERLLHDADALRLAVRLAADGRLGSLRLGFCGSVAWAHAPRAAQKLKAALPQVELSLHGEQLTATQVSGLQEGRIDIGLLRPPVGSPRVCFRTIDTEPLVAVLPADHRLAGQTHIGVAELADEPFVSYRPALGSVVQRRAEELCTSAGYSPRISVGVAETGTLMGCVAAGMGVALMPASVAAAPIVGAVVRPLAGEAPGVELAVAWRRDEDDPVVLQGLKALMPPTAGRRGPMAA